MSIESPLKELLNRKAKVLSDVTPNPAEIRNEWLGAIGNLFSSIENWIGDTEGVDTSREQNHIEEEQLGLYEIDNLLLKVGDQTVRVRPKGRFIIGAQGRVDIIGEKGMASIIRRDNEWQRIIREHELRFESFDESVFANILSEVMK